MKIKSERTKTARPAAEQRTTRRDFCRTATLAALGIWSIADLKGFETLAARPDSASGSGSGRKEESMEKQVKAVTAKVISVKGECGVHKAGDVCAFTAEGVQGKVCIHAMYSMLPKVFAMLYGAKFPWLQNPDVASHACPDGANPVIFEITRIYEG